VWTAARGPRAPSAETAYTANSAANAVRTGRKPRDRLPSSRNGTAQEASAPASRRSPSDESNRSVAVFNAAANTPREIVTDATT